MADEQEDEIDLWAFAGEQLGLGLDADGRLAGHDPYGVPLTAERVEGRTRVRAALDFPLRMGLHLRVRDVEEVAEPGPLGFSTLEAVYEVEVVDVEHAKRVLGPCVPALLEAARRTPSLEADDERVWAWLDDDEPHPDDLGAALTTVAVVARWLRGQRSQELADWEQKLSQAWPTIASTWGLALDMGRLRMAGAAFGTRFEIWVEPGPPPRTGLRVRIDPPLGFTLSISRAGDTLLEERWNDGEPFETGDPELDAFRVVGGPEDALRDRLGPNGRDRLLVLLERAGAIRFAEDHVELWSPGAVTHGGGFEAMIGDARKAAEQIREPDPADIKARGPYR